MRLMHNTATYLWVLTCLALTASAAQAQDSVDLNRYSPAPLATDGFAVGHAREGVSGEWDLQLQVNYAHDPLVFEVTSGDSESESLSIVRHHLMGHVLASGYVLPQLALFVELPVHLWMEGDEPPTGTAPAEGDMIGDPRFGARFTLLSGEHFNLAAQAQLWLPLSKAAHDSVYGGGDFVRGEPSLLASLVFGKLAFNLSAGAIITRKAELSNLSTGSAMTFGVGVQRAINPANRIYVEAYGQSHFANFFGREETPLEVLAGYKHQPATGAVFGVAAGTGLSRGFGSPDFRAVATLGFHEEPIQDTDGDGIFNDVDRCPTSPEDKDNFEDRDGCPDVDNDNDGIEDDRDQCPMEPEDKDGFEDENGCPEPDNDGDGIADADDQCPMEPEDKDGFEDEDGCPEADNDKDGVADAQDECPLVAGVPAHNGCPIPDRDGDGVPDARDNCPDEAGPPENQGCQAAQQVVITEERLEILDKVYFKTNRATIQRRSFTLLENIAQVIVAHPEITKLRVEGHTDSRGPARRNLKLAQARADAVKAYLVQAGVEESRLEAEGFGEDRPVVADATSDDHHSQNRRVEFRIVQDTMAADLAATAPTNETSKSPASTKEEPASDAGATE